MSCEGCSNYIEGKCFAENPPVEKLPDETCFMDDSNESASQIEPG